MRIKKKQVENVKTVLLNVLVVTSLFLTWQIWTYEPDYEKEVAPAEASPVGVCRSEYKRCGEAESARLP